MKRISFLVLAAMVLIAMPAFAETQNVKVGGDITSYFGKLSDLDLMKGTDANSNTTDDFFTTTTRLYVSADLTDNVQTYVRLINEREWDTASNIQTDANVGAAESSSDVQIDNAYIKLSEFLYSPLTLIIGRQDIVWGSGLLLADGDGTNNGNLGIYPYVSSRIAFDAARAIFDYDPWTLDIVAGKVDEDQSAATSDEQDHDFYGANLSYVFPSEWLVEGTYVGSYDQNTALAAAPSIHMVGARTEGPVTVIDDNLNFQGEVAYQFGDYSRTTDISAWAVVAGASYAFDNEYKPIVGLKYDFRSGEEASNGGDYNGWITRFDNYKIGNLIEKLWIEAYAPNNAADTRGNGGNISAVTTSGSIIPIEDVELSLDWVWAQADEELSASGKDYIGNEFIGTVTYDYTEDVTFAFMGSYFDPDDAFRTTENDAAYELIGSVAVEF